MLRRLGKTAVVAALACAGVATPAHATSAAYCNPGPGNSTAVSGVSGTVTYTVPVASQTVPVLTTWIVDVTLRCPAGVAPATGDYHLRFTGTSSETCPVGGGGGSVDTTVSAKTAGLGAGPVVAGSWQYTRAGIHYYGYPGSGNGDIWVQETPVTQHHYKVYMWLDLIPTLQNGNCPGLGGQLIGHATITEP